MAEEQFLPIVGPEKGKILIDAIRRAKPKRVLEVGTLIGYSAILMGKELDGDAEIITIEIDKDEADVAEKNIRESRIKPQVTVMIGDALEVISKLEGKFDFVFLDATKNEYLDYLKLVEDKLHPGSIVAADNAGIFASSMKDYLDYVRKSGKYKSQFTAVGKDGVEVSIKL